MYRRNIFYTLSMLFGIGCLAGCTEKGEAVAEKKYTSIDLRAYTTDPLRLSVSLNDEVITESLVTPEGNVTKVIYFDDYRQRVRVYNTANNALFIDTTYQLQTGKLNVFTIYQTQKSESPFYLAPPPGEPPAAPGYTKLSIIYTGSNMPDSAKVVVENRLNGTAYQPTDSLILEKDKFSRYFEVLYSQDSYVRFYQVTDRSPIGQRLFQPRDLNPDFSIYRLIKASGISLRDTKLY